jgi:hypothetical protein
MSERTKGTDFESKLIVEEDLEMPPEEASNAYFLLDLNIPGPKKDVEVVQKGYQNETNMNVGRLHKFGFLELLEKIHGRDLRTNNPWLNPTASRIHWKARYGKHVRFRTTEISSKHAELPWSRNRGDIVIRPGQLHAPNCRNSNQETVEVLVEHVWQNRVFILREYMSNALHTRLVIS